jgi:adenylylsulfate kinase-like enzyme
MDWILGLGVDDQNAVILWLYGPAGAGKSAIAHDIAHRCDLEKLPARQLLLLSFRSHTQ